LVDISVLTLSCAADSQLSAARPEADADRPCALRLTTVDGAGLCVAGASLREETGTALRTGAALRLEIGEMAVMVAMR
jgi:hypothetical protein